MGVLEQTVDRAISKNWISSSDREAVITKINQLAKKFGFDPHDFATLTHVESYGMNPKADKLPGRANTCAGIIQWCPNSGSPDTKTIGGKNYVVRSILELNILQQLELVDAYFEDVITPSSKRNNIDLGNLYFYVLYPGIASRYSTFPDNSSISAQVGRQAPILYENGVITKASVVKGVKKQAEINLNTSIVASQNIQSGGGSNDSLGSGSVTGSASLGAGSTLASIGICSSQFPIKFTIKEALTFVGCINREIGNPMGSTSSLSSSANGMKINGGSNFNIADFNPTVPICEGCLAFPFKKDIRITSPFCQRRVSKSTGRVYYHSGTDYGGFEGEEVIAVADGTVISPLIAGSGYNPGFVDIVHENIGNLVSRSAHIIPSVQPGTVVKQGDVIGKVGPYPRGPHLHLELRKDKGAGGSAYSVEECKTKFLDPALFCKKL